ncbi:MAG: GTP 3',8-cyclase MoaA [Dehalococcoidia bacterium]|nr:GTP 3',8-cyclase MoaA [Dehalococcoidia bacterium]
MTGLFDSFVRCINYLRISVTDRCNLRCIYCMPPEGISWISHSELLSYEEISAIVQIAAELGVNKIRLTGGEPLARADLPKLIEMLSQLERVEEVSLTTNGTLLKKYALELKQAGLRRVNISLDTLKADKFQKITRLGELKDALSGIEASKEAGLHPIKINMVVMKNINDDEVLDFASMTYKEELHVRFIELMPFSKVAEPVPASELRWRISRSLGMLEPCPSPPGNGPAQCYSLPGARGTIGFISPITEPFCSSCNRLRLTSYGQLCPCLLSDEGIDLRGPLRNNASAKELEHLILSVVASKPEQHKLADGIVPMKRNMSQIGG